MARAHIRFIPEARKAPPSGPRYFCTATVPGSDRHWSLVVDYDGVVNARGEVDAVVAYLVPDAAPDNLNPGQLISMFEGRTLVATGRILG